MNICFEVCEGRLVKVDVIIWHRSSRIKRRGREGDRELKEKEEKENRNRNNKEEMSDSEREKKENRMRSRKEEMSTVMDNEEGE